LLVNTGYNMTIAYMGGDNLKSEVTGRLLSGSAPVIFYGFLPDAFAARVGGDMIEFEEWTQECEDTFTPEPTLSGVTCGKEKGLLAKVANASMLASEPELKVRERGAGKRSCPQSSALTPPPLSTPPALLR
jgi:hypothetical protein